VWNGRELRDQRVLIRCYHGLGDTIQFIRYAPLVRAVARDVAAWVQPALLPLLSSAAGIDRLLPLHDGTPSVEYDVDVEVMELPYVFRTTLPMIPATVPYLHASPVSCSEPLMRVGILWRAGEWDGQRSIPFDVVSPLFGMKRIAWHSLQLETRPAERHDALRTPQTNGVDRLAALIAALDLVISVDSMAAHLAGALAIPVWTLLPHQADWRWMTARADTPWYPTMRLFRQPAQGDWAAVVDEVREALQ
jgi:hypothetical protein